MKFDDLGIKGPDVSFYQGNPKDGLYVNFQKMKDYGVNFVIFKAGQLTWADPAFAYNWKEAKRVGLLRASYWFLDYRDSGANQVRRYWEMMKDDPGEGPLIVDFEVGSGDWPRLKDFLVTLKAVSGYPDERIWIYTGYFYWRSYGPSDDSVRLWFLRHPLWLAWYTDKPEDVLSPYPWVSPILWQKGTTIVYGPDLGVHSLELDWNVFNGNESRFRQYFTVGGNVFYKAIGNITIRTSPEITDNATGQYVLLGDIVESDVTQNGFAHILNIYRNDVKIVIPPVAWCGTYYLEITNYVPPQPAIKVPFTLDVAGYKLFAGELEKL
jgi:GH25 family lysozyme M1 (1,4-beta-N-acetylmuramidase)